MTLGMRLDGSAMILRSSAVVYPASDAISADTVETKMLTFHSTV